MYGHFLLQPLSAFRLSPVTILLVVSGALLGCGVRVSGAASLPVATGPVGNFVGDISAAYTSSSSLEGSQVKVIQ